MQTAADVAALGDSTRQSLDALTASATDLGADVAALQAADAVTA